MRVEGAGFLVMGLLRDVCGLQGYVEAYEGLLGYLGIIRASSS